MGTYFMYCTIMPKFVDEFIRKTFGLVYIEIAKIKHLPISETKELDTKREDSDVAAPYSKRLCSTHL